MACGINHQIAGEFFYDGLKFSRVTNPEVLESVKVYPLTKDDILISTYPKSGTHWVQEITWLIMNDGKASTDDLDKRVPWMEYDYGGRKGLDLLTTGPNIIKTHLPYFYHKQAVNISRTKIIVVMRNIRDLLVSCYHFYRMNATMGNFTGTWSDFFELFKQKRLHLGDWADFNLGWWKKRHLANVLILFYEDIKEDPERETRRLAQFCGKNCSDDTLRGIVRLTTFDAMKANPAVNKKNVKNFNHSISPLMRKGEVGDWKNYFTPEQVLYLEKNYEPKLNAAGLKFRYEL